MPLPFDPVQEAETHWISHGWASAAPGMAAVTSVMRAQQILLARVDAVLRPLGLTFARYETLMLLLFSRTGTLPMGVVGKRLQVHPTSVTNSVDRLERDNMVARLAHPTDRRAILVTLTALGHERAESATTILNEVVFEQVGLDMQQTTKLTETLAIMRANSGDF
jgi:DNA-binding MarR family transcriptional regulator